MIGRYIQILPEDLLRESVGLNFSTRPPLPPLPPLPQPILVFTPIPFLFFSAKNYPLRVGTQMSWDVLKTLPIISIISLYCRALVSCFFLVNPRDSLTLAPTTFIPTHPPPDDSFPLTSHIIDEP
ncbi:hypothetical protein RRG08_001168 [Elysia crispata]|uniref:Uncharacterized protein n=1 Tax=Elysia crispata TaxID=231223 RepID=A0AAE1A4C0_9GAST|nr:hypothetical protein RRG08_001168 [Elysia crispata]